MEANKLEADNSYIPTPDASPLLGNAALSYQDTGSLASLSEHKRHSVEVTLEAPIANSPIPEASSQDEIDTQDDPRTLSLQRTMVERIRKVWIAATAWMRSNSFAPTWLPGTWRHARTGYMLALVGQLLAALIAVVIFHVLPGFRFVGAFSLFGIILAAVLFGAGPSLFATAVGAVLLVTVVLRLDLPPTTANVSEIPGILVFLALGATMSILPGQRAQARRTADLAEEEASTRAALMEAVFAAVPDRIAIFDASGTIMRLNPSAQAKAGPTRQQATLGEVGDLYGLRNAAGEPYQPQELPLAQALHGEAQHGVEMHLRDAHGRDQTVLASAAPYFDAEGNVAGAVSVVHDITERRALEQRTHDALDALLAMAEALVRPADGRGQQLSSVQEVVAQDVTETVDGGRRSPMAQRLAELTRDVLGCTRVGIAVVEPETRLTRAVAVVGLTPEQEARWWEEQATLERQGQRLGDGADPDELARFAAGEAFVIDMTKPPYDALPNPYHITTSLYVPMCADGTLVGILSLDHGGPPHAYTEAEKALASGVANLAAVVIERDRLLRERHDAQAQAAALQETARRIDAFLGMASHELRTPLTSITANVQIATRLLSAVTARSPLALSGAEPQSVQTNLERTHRALGAALRQILRLNRLVGDLLDATRVQADKLQLEVDRCDLATIVAVAIEEQRVAWPERTITLETEGDRVYTLDADADRIGQVVTNFLTNALKYSSPDAPVMVRLLAHDSRGRVEVIDQGPGLSAAQQAHLFERFSQVPDIYQQSGGGTGLGLGLYICKTIIGRHGGLLGVQSAPGKGSCFWFELTLGQTIEAL